MSDGEADLGGAISRRDDGSCIVEHLCHIVFCLSDRSSETCGAPDQAPSADAEFGASLATFIISYLVPDAP